MKPLDELIKELRDGGCEYGCNPKICVCSLCDEAADALERQCRANEALLKSKRKAAAEAKRWFDFSQRAAPIIRELAEDRGNYIIHSNKDLVLRARELVAATDKL